VAKKSTNIVKRGPSCPAEIGAGEFIGLRLPATLLKRIDAWAKTGEDCKTICGGPRAD
jgi:hypothetical protein